MNYDVTRKLGNLGILMAILLCLVFISAPSYAEAISDIEVNTSLRNGILQKEPSLEFSYTIRYKNENGRIVYLEPDKVLVGNVPCGKYGNSYRCTLKEGLNRILIQYTNKGQPVFDIYEYSLDTKPPYINVNGLYDNMTTNTRQLSFSLQTGDEQAVPEAISEEVYLNNEKLTINNGVYRGILNTSLPNYARQIEKTEDKHATNNVVRIKATDGLGNSVERTYNVIYTPRSIPYSQLRYLIEKVPGLRSEEALYKNIGRYSPVGVALDDSNITELGTFGGYVVLGHDVPIYNNDGDDFMVNAHWSDQNIPLTSVMVMQDTNKNNKPDDVWYYVNDNIDALKYARDFKVSYSLKNKGEYMDRYGNLYKLNMQIPVRTPFSTPYFQTAKELHRNFFSSSYYSMVGHWYKMHREPIEKLHFNTKGYDLDDIEDKNGKKVALDSIDFVKVYTNTFDVMTELGSVMPAVNYIMVVEDTPRLLAYDKEDFLNSEEIQCCTPGNTTSFKIKNHEDSIVTSISIERIRPLVDDLHVFSFPQKIDYDQLPYRIEDNQIITMYPYDRSVIHIERTSLPDSKTVNDFITPYNDGNYKEQLNSVELTQSINMIRGWINHPTSQLTISQEGELELIMDKLIKIKLKRVNAQLSNLNNSDAFLQNLKWLFDFLSESELATLDNELINAFDKKLLHNVSYKGKNSFTIINENNQFTITATKGIGLNINTEELRRDIVPSVQITKNTSTDEPNSILSFRTEYFKDNRKILDLYHPISYKIVVKNASIFSENHKLYYLSHGDLIEVPMSLNEEDKSIVFETKYLGRFILN